MQGAYKKSTLPKSAQRVVEHYYNINLGGKKVVTPYFMNERGKRGRRAFVGKGTPEELEKATQQTAKKHNFNLHAATASQIRAFMIKHELGIDCSGFVSWVLNAIVREKRKKSLWRYINFQMLPFVARVKSKVRPVENISVKVLTHPKNSTHIESILEIKVGDMIRIYGGNHILLISEMTYDNGGNPVGFKYVNSTMYKDQHYGIRTGTVKIQDKNKYLIGQEWLDEEKGINWIYNEIKNYEADSRIVRLNALTM